MAATTTVRPVALDPQMAKRLARAVEQDVEARRKRDEMIVRAAISGATLREIAEVVGLTHVGVKKIIDRTKIVRIHDGGEPMLLREALAKGLPQAELVTEPDPDE